MGCFNDLPNDVIWLILRIYLKKRLGLSDKSLLMYEVPWPIESMFSEEYIGPLTCKLALTSKRFLKVVKSKTVYFRRGWLFKKGALTDGLL